jgi:hypothetical protein
MGTFAAIAKWALVGVGSVLSLVPAVGPLVGAPLIGAGLSIQTNRTGAADTGVDQVSANAQILANTFQSAAAIQNVAAGGSAINVNPFLTFLQKYWMYLVGALAALWILPKIFKK